MQKRSLMFILAAVFALGLVTAAPPPAAADEGTFAVGSPQSMWPTTADIARTGRLASKAVQDLACELFRSAEGTYQSACFSSGFTCSAGTGFNVNVAPGWCVYDYATGADAEHSRCRIVRQTAAQAATNWVANPGADTYYVHVAYGEATADGVESPDPVITVNTDASLAGALTVCSVVVAGAEPDATTYTYNDLRRVGNGLHYAPTPLTTYTAADVRATDDMFCGDDMNIVDALTFGPEGGPYTVTIDATAGTGDFAGTVEVGDLSIDSAVLASTPAEIDAVADLSAVKMLPRVCSVLVDTAPERTGGAHAICTLPAKAVVTDVWVEITTQEATEATKIVDIGPAGTAAGYADDLSVAAADLLRPRPVLTAGGNETYFASTTRGTLLATLVAGADVAGDVGTYYEFPDVASGGLVVSYTVPAAGFNEFVGTFYVQHLEVP